MARPEKHAPAPPLAGGEVERIAAIFSPVNVRRFIPGFIRYRRPNTSIWQLSIYHEEKETLELLKRWQPVGIVSEYVPGVTEKVAALGIPTVVATYDASHIPDASWVEVDNRLAGRMGADFLVAKKLRSFGFYGRRTWYSRERLDGFETRLRELGFDLQTYWDETRNPQRYSEYWPEPGEGLQAWLASLPKPAGILASHDPSGRALIEACRYAGIEVPREAAILGINDDPLVCDISNPELSSVRVPWTRMAMETLSVLESRIRGGRPGGRLVAPTMVTEKLSTDVLAVENPLLRRALEHIRDHLTEGLDVNQLVRSLGCSRRHLERLFRDELNLTPKEEILHRRIAMARDLLLGTDHKINNIATLCGFSGPERFNIAFRKAEGITPGQFRTRSGRSPYERT